MKTTIGAGMLVLAITAFGAGCSAPVSGSDDANGTGAQANPATGPTGTAAPGPAGGAVDANTRYVAEPDQAKAQQIVVRMWTTLASQGCWYMQGSTNNYSFSGMNDYRYAGYETTSGQVTPVSGGAFGGYDMAEVMIRDNQLWVGIYDAQNMAISQVYNGKLTTNWYKASATCI